MDYCSKHSKLTEQVINVTAAAIFSMRIRRMILGRSFSSASFDAATFALESAAFAKIEPATLSVVSAGAGFLLEAGGGAGGPGVSAGGGEGSAAAGVEESPPSSSQDGVSPSMVGLRALCGVLLRLFALPLAPGALQQGKGTCSPRGVLRPKGSKLSWVWASC